MIVRPGIEASAVATKYLYEVRDTKRHQEKEWGKCMHVTPGIFNFWDNLLIVAYYMHGGAMHPRAQWVINPYMNNNSHPLLSPCTLHACIYIHTSVTSIVQELLTSMQACDAYTIKDIFPETFKLYHIEHHFVKAQQQCMERSLSKMKMIKTRLRNRLSDVNLCID